MKTLFISTLLIFSLSIFSNAQTADKATMKVTVTDFKENPKKGERIIFESKTNKKTYKGTSGADGTFKVDLPGGDTYMIKINAIGAAKDYNEIAIPTLQEGQMYGELTVLFELPNVITLDNLHFDTGKSTIRSSSYKTLNDLAEYMLLKPDLKIEIGGHTDNVGEDASNMTLSEKRAEAVKAYLIKKGVKATSLTSKGYGETKPVSKNDTAKGRQMNRRTEIKVISK